MPPKKKTHKPIAPQNINKSEKKAIEGKYATFQANPQAKAEHWEKLDPVKRVEAEKFWEILVRNGGTSTPANAASSNLTGSAQVQAGAVPPLSQPSAGLSLGSADATATPVSTIAPDTSGPDSAPLVSNDSVSSTLASASQRSLLTATPLSTGGSNPLPTLSNLSLGSAPQVTTAVDVNNEVVETGMETPETVTEKDLTASNVKQDLTTDMRDQVQALAKSNHQLQYPLRQPYETTPDEVITNHFNLRIGDETLHQYKILPVLTGKNKRRIRLIVETAIEQCAFLRDNQRLFATDYFDTIVAWTNLHEQISSSQHTLLSGDGQMADSLWHLITLQEGQTTISLQLKYEGIVDVKGLIGHSNMDINHAADDLQPTLRALNILVSKSFEEQPVDAVRIGANKFFLKASHEELTNGKRDPEKKVSVSLCTLRGYSYSVKPGGGCVLLIINAATSAFWNPVLVSDVLGDFTTFDDEFALKKALKGVRVYILHDRGTDKDDETFQRLNSDHARVKPIEGFGVSFSEETFIAAGNTQPTNTLEHFKATYPEEFVKVPEATFSDYWAVNLGSRHEPRWYPAHCLRILPYQKFKGLVPENLSGGMLNIACQKPPMAMALIGYEGIRAMGMVANSSTPTQMPQCPALTLDPRMLRVPSNNMPYPTVLYKDRQERADSRWKIQDHTLLVRPNKSFRVLGIAQEVAAHGLQTAFDHLQSYAGPPRGKFKNYDVAQLHISDTIIVDPSQNAALISRATAARNNDPSIDFAMLFLNKSNTTAYANFKDMADRKLGLHSVCITKRCIDGKIGEKMSNIALKMNLKSAGTNHSTANGMIKQYMKDTLVLGADVTHPGTGAIPGTPSIAAIVGSVDQHGGRFLGSMRLQNETRKEIIDHVRPMVEERVIAWAKRQKPTRPKKNEDKFGRLPTNIIYYRDGISDPQFLDVKKHELSAIEAGFKDAWEYLAQHNIINNWDPEPPKINITALVCVKRHNTRFYPLEGQEDEYDNCPPGTQVESVVPSPFFMDFYLQSHAAIKGTAKPCHYFVLRNDMNMSMRDIRTLTHELCYTYVRAPCGVSYASPAYYADHLCERGRIYLRHLYLRTSEGAQLRSQFDTFKWRAEDERMNKRVARFGVLRNEDGSPRRKGEDEVKIEERHRKEVVELCDAWTLRKAREEWYGDGNDVEGKNPWRESIDDTMFWM